MAFTALRAFAVLLRRLNAGLRQIPRTSRPRYSPAMSDHVQDVARRCLERFVERYAGITETQDDPVRPAADAARSALAAGPTRHDLQHVAALAADAFPDDPRAAALADEWQAEVLRAEDDHGDNSGPIAG